MATQTPEGGSGSQGAGNGGKTMQVLATIIGLAVVVMGVIAVLQRTGAAFKPEHPFKCTSCGHVKWYDDDQLQRMEATFSPIKGQMTGPCPRCSKKTFTEARKCPSCGEVFVIEISDDQSSMNDACPKCGTNYYEAKRKKLKG